MPVKICNSMKFICILFFTVYILSHTVCSGQNAAYDSKQFNLLLSSVGKGATKFNKKEARLSKNYFKKYLKTERRINKKLCKIDPALADYLFSFSKDPLYYHSNYEDIKQEHFVERSPKIYTPTIDTLDNAFEYFNLNKDSFEICDDTLLASSKLSLKMLNQDISKANDFQKYLRERKINLKETLSKYPQLSGEVLKLDKLNYYFIEFTSGLKKELIDQIKLNDFYSNFVSKNLDIKKFMDLNSSLSSLFKIPSDWGNTTNGLQKNNVVRADIANTIASQGGILDVVKKELGPMHESIDKIKSSTNLTNVGDAPSFKPNELKSESVLKRLHFGLDYQIDKTISFYPSQVSINGKVGFQLTSRVISGIGLAYSFLLGDGWNNRNFDELNKRSFAYFDYKILKNIYFESAFEKNLVKKPVSKEVLGIKDDFFDSILAGVKYKKKISKKLSMTFSLLYDFKNSNQGNMNSPIVYRFGWEY